MPTSQSRLQLTKGKIATLVKHSVHLCPVLFVVEEYSQVSQWVCTLTGKN